MAKTTEISATGRRKTAVAHVWLVPGTGTIKVNGRDLSDYFDSEALRNYILQPLKLTNMLEKYNISAKLTGGGITGQGGALRHSKASGCLTRDARMKERKKPGQPGARKRFQFSKR